MGLLKTLRGRNEFIVQAINTNKSQQKDKPFTYYTMARNRNKALEKVKNQHFKRDEIENYHFNVYSERDFVWYAKFEIDRQTFEVTNEISAYEYYNNFANEMNSYFEQFTVLKEELVKLDEQEIEQLTIRVLSNAITFQRSMSKAPMKHPEHNLAQFIIAATRHLADVLHNIPRTLNYIEWKKDRQIDYICEYFCFLKAFNNLKPNIISYVYSMPNDVRKYLDLLE